VTAKADEVETISKTKREVKITIGKQLENGRKFLTLTKPDLPFLLHLYIATAFTIHILILNDSLIFFLSLLSTFKFKDLRDNPFRYSLQKSQLPFENVNS
jgi:hypothetical protein